MIANVMNLHSPKNSSDKLPADISDASEDLLATEPTEFSVYASASLSQLQELSSSTSLGSIYGASTQEQARVGGQSLAHSTLDTKLLADKPGKALQLQQGFSNEINLDKPVNSPSNHALTSPSKNQGDPLLTTKSEKAPTQARSGVQTQQFLQTESSINQVVKTQKAEATFQANLVSNQLLQASVHVTDNEPNNLGITLANRTQATVSQWGPVPITSNAPLAQQAQEMLTPLREQLRFQIDQKIKHAELRLDPPSLGKVELNIRLDGDRLHIQIHAANPSVRDSLLMGLERLREELAMDHGGQIDLDIGQGKKRGQHHERHATNITESQADFGEPEAPQPDHLNNQIDLLA